MIRFYLENLKRVFKIKTIVCILIIPFFIMLDTDDNFLNMLLNRRDYSGMDMVYYIFGMLQWGLYHGLVLLVAVIPFACEISREWKEGFSHQVIQRIGVKRYTGMHIAISGISGGITVMSGFWLYVGILSLRLPVFLNNGINAESFVEGAYGTWLMGEPWKYLLAISVCWFFVGVASAVAAVAASGVCFNRYIIIIVPYVIWNIYIEAAKIFHIPNHLRLDWILMGKIQIGKGMTGVWSVALIMTIIAFSCWIFCYKKMKERMQSGGV